MSEQVMTRREATARPSTIVGWCLVALVLAPTLVLVAHLLQAAPVAHDTASELASIAASPLRYQASGSVGFCAVVLYVPGLIAMATPVRAARPWLGGVGLGLSITGLLSLTSLMGSGPVSLAMAQAPERAAMIRVTDAYESAPLTVAWMLLMLVGFSLGPVVLGIGLWRSGFTIVIPVLLATGLVVQMLDAGRWWLALGYALSAAGMTLAAATIWRQDSVVRGRETSSFVRASADSKAGPSVVGPSGRVRRGWRERHIPIV